MPRYLALLRRRDYALLWWGATISALGDGMSFIALVWLVLDRGGDPAQVGWLAAVYTAPVLVGGLAAGVVLDRFDRRRVLIGDNLVRGIAIVSVPVAAWLGTLTTAHLFLVAGIYGLLFMTSLAGIPSMIPTLVSQDELTTANAMESLSYGIAGLAGPALAGVIIATVGAPVVLAADAASYGVFVVCLASMGLGAGSRAAASTSGGAGAATPDARWGPGLRPAVRFILATPAIVAITLLYMAANVGEGMFLVLAPVYARDVLGGGSAAYGLLVSAFAGGGLAGTFVVGAIRWRWPLGRSIAAAVTLTGITFGVLVASPPLVPTLCVLAAAGVIASSLTAWAQTVRMRLIPPQLRGRVFALLRTLMQATPPIGSVVAGTLLAAGSGAPAVVALIAAVIAVPGAVALLSPALGSSATGEPGAVGGPTGSS